MDYSEARRRRFLSFGQRTTMLYALERESDLGSTSTVFVELSERGDVSSGPVPRVWNLPPNGLPLDQSLQRDGAGRTRRSQPPPTHLFPRDAGADRDRDLCASGQASVLGRAEAQGKAEDATGRRGVACGQYPRPPGKKEGKLSILVARAANGAPQVCAGERNRLTLASLFR
jgi:hypothetical protein